MAEYNSPDRMSPEQKGRLRLCREAMKGSDISDSGVRAEIERTGGDVVNVRLLDASTGKVICIARFRSDGHLQTFLDKAKEPWEEFLFPQPG